jgi:hypothetical protein
MDQKLDRLQMHIGGCRRLLPLNPVRGQADSPSISYARQQKKAPIPSAHHSGMLPFEVEKQ